MVRYAISDIHGCAKTFKALLRRINFSRKDELFLLGDFIDRGPDSKGVIDHIWDLRSKGFNVRCLRGNHEQMMLYASFSKGWRNTWLAHGGWETLNSFDENSSLQTFEPYLAWMKALPYFLEVDNYILVHAGLNFYKVDPFKDFGEMIWLRYWYDSIRYDWLGDRIIVHGHAPLRRDLLLKMFNELETKQVINIDNGCVLDKPGCRRLAAFDMTHKKLIFQPNIDTEPLVTTKTEKLMYSVKQFLSST